MHENDDRLRSAARDTAANHAGKGTPVLGSREPFLPLSFATLAAPLLWALHFAFLYLLEGFLCEAPVAGAEAVPAVIIIATLIGATLCAASFFAGDAWLRRVGALQLESHAFLRITQRLLAGLSFVAVMWSGAGALMLGPCTFAY